MGPFPFSGLSICGVTIEFLKFLVLQRQSQLHKKNLRKLIVTPQVDKPEKGNGGKWHESKGKWQKGRGDAQSNNTETQPKGKGQGKGQNQGKGKGAAPTEGNGKKFGKCLYCQKENCY